VLAAFAAALLCTGLLARAEPPSSAPAGPPSESAVRGAVASLESDPALGTTRKTHVLARTSGPRQPDAPSEGGSHWLGGLLTWVDETARTLLWVAGGLAFVLLGIYFVRLIQLRTERIRVSALAAPTHVRDLDIRPESLPADISAAALALWDQGEHRAALALLYRGMLSRLVHAHSAPIRHSSTEAECEQLAAPHLDARQKACLARLVQVWQDAVYGGKEPTSGDFSVLCAQLEPLLGASGSAAAAREAA